MSLSGAQKRKLAALKKEKEAENQFSLSRWIRKQKPSPCEPLCNSASEQTTADVSSSPKEVTVPQIEQAGNETPRGTTTPVAVTAKGKSKRSFNASYYEKHPWLEYSVQDDSVYWFCCRRFGGTSSLLGQRNGSRPFIDVGVRRWKDISNVLEQHTRSDRHKDSAVSWTEFKALETKEMQPIASVLMTDRNEDIKGNIEHVKGL
ncbi:hypothetical protein QYM36_008730 [Artemia franciscana]|uniref:TTF-type domain-containing protein n=1 Tax=Artemia franciscana TaxID=6661 RepID=A0AA88HM03_ARTSF|nr:hypothetical protein QYM36_008730 [Artemia franciscana]